MRPRLALAACLLLASCMTGLEESPEQVERSYPLRYALAIDVVMALAPEKDGESRVLVMADPKNNSVIVKGTEADQERLGRRIKELDVRK